MHSPLTPYQYTDPLTNNYIIARATRSCDYDPEHNTGLQLSVIESYTTTHIECSDILPLSAPFSFGMNDDGLHHLQISWKDVYLLVSVLNNNEYDVNMIPVSGGDKVFALIRDSASFKINSFTTTYQNATLIKAPSHSHDSGIVPIRYNTHISRDAIPLFTVINNINIPTVIRIVPAINTTFYHTLTTNRNHNRKRSIHILNVLNRNHNNRNLNNHHHKRRKLSPPSLQLIEEEEKEDEEESTQVEFSSEEEEEEEVDTFQCLKCNKSFVFACNLNRHITNVHSRHILIEDSTDNDNESNDIEILSPPITINIADDEEEEEEEEEDMEDDDIFVANMSFAEANNLDIGDNFDHRDKFGRVFAASVADKKNTNLFIHYEGWANKWNVWNDYDMELWRFSTYGSISRRRRHRLFDLTVGDYIDISFGNMYSWTYGEIKQLDGESGQVQVQLVDGEKDTVFWVHLDNTEEVAVFASKANLRHVNKEQTQIRAQIKRQQTNVTNDNTNICELPIDELMHKGHTGRTHKMDTHNLLVPMPTMQTMTAPQYKECKSLYLRNMRNMRNDNRNNNNWGQNAFTFSDMSKPLFSGPARVRQRAAWFPSGSSRLYGNRLPERRRSRLDLYTYDNNNNYNNNGSDERIKLRRLPKSKSKSDVDTDSSSESEYVDTDESESDFVNNAIDICKWDSNDIYEWIVSIDKERFGKYKDLKKTLLDEELSGNDLIGITEQNLKEFGITRFSDKKLLFNKIQSILPKDVKNNSKSRKSEKKEIEDDDIPDQFLDPISYEIMEDPVLCSKSGYTYERKIIEHWIETNGADPMTRQKN